MQKNCPPSLLVNFKISNIDQFDNFLALQPGFKKFWQKIFLSEASVAIMQDFFWWFFLENYEVVMSLSFLMQ
jgi:hypothetical protein